MEQLYKNATNSINSTSATIKEFMKNNVFCSDMYVSSATNLNMLKIDGFWLPKYYFDDMKQTTPKSSSCNATCGYGIEYFLQTYKLYHYKPKNF